MHLVLLSSSALLALAVGWSFALLRRLRDWRAGFVIAWLGASMVLLVLAIGGQVRSAATDVAVGPGELQQLAISGIALAAVLYFHVVFQRDALTGLPNRALLIARLHRALGRVHRGRDGACAVLFLDLDRFKVINDGLGHRWGDQLLVAVAARLQTCVRRGDTIARLGGDEFVVLLQGEDLGGATQAAERLQRTLSEPVTLRGQEIVPTVSIGIAVSSRGTEGTETLLREADMAMYRAKLGGKSRHEIFKFSMQADAVERLALESELRKAATQRQFVLHYQPIVSLKQGQLAGLEALLRWQRSGRGLLLPETFIPVAEETGLIVPIDLWVLEEACRQMRTWQERYPPLQDVLIHVNLSGRQFTRPDLVEQITSVLERSGLPAYTLGLEITETVMMNDAEMATSILARLQALGVKLQIDDFGTGYSSLSYLHRFPVACLKIDRSFVIGIEDHEENAKIVRSINTLARDLQMDAVAEGIETATQLELLRAWGCRFGQGNYLCAPADPRELDPILSRGRLTSWRKGAPLVGAL